MISNQDAPTDFVGLACFAGRRPIALDFSATAGGTSPSDAIDSGSLSRRRFVHCQFANALLGLFSSPLARGFTVSTLSQ